MSSSLIIASAFVLAVLAERYRRTVRYAKTCKVVGLFIYPVKGLHGIEMKSVEALNRGFKHDRRFMVVDDEGNFITQRELPKMATVKCEIVNDITLKLTNEEGSSITVTNWAKAGPKRTVRVWKSMVDNVVDQGDQAAQFLSKAIGKSCRLVFMGEDAHRPVNPEVADGHEVSFADGYPYLIASTSSLAELNRRVKTETIPMSRFRPNIVLEGLYPWTEDLDGARIRFPSGHVLQIVKPCDRCKVTTIDQDRGIMQPSQEPLKTLRTFRRIKDTVDVFFATNAILEKESNKPITVGAVGEMDWFSK